MSAQETPNGVSAAPFETPNGVSAAQFGTESEHQSLFSNGLSRPSIQTTSAQDFAKETTQVATRVPSDPMDSSVPLTNGGDGERDNATRPSAASELDW